MKTGQQNKKHNRAGSRVVVNLIRNITPLLLALLPFPATAQPAPTPPEISPAFSAKLDPLRDAIAAKNNTAALAQIDALLPATRTGTYDHFALLQIQAQLLLTQNTPTPAIPPLETLLTLDATHTAADPQQPAWLTPQKRRDLLHTLAQLHYTLAANQPATAPVAEHRAAFQRSLHYARQAAADPTLLTPEIQGFLASALYAAATVGTTAPDKQLLAETLAAAQHGLSLTVTPRRQFYLLLIAANQQLAQHLPAAENLELLVQLAPENKTCWSQLAGAWLTVADDAAARQPERPAAIRSARLRAVNAIERGQQHGALDTPRDRQNLISLYLNLDSPESAIPLLETGLRDNLLDPAAAHTNWELLIASYQKLNDTAAALAACAAASGKNPGTGRFELQASQLLYHAGRLDDALAATRAALAKGNLPKPGPAHIWHAWLALELAHPDEAAAALDRAATLPDARPDEIARLRAAIAEKLKTQN